MTTYVVTNDANGSFNVPAGTINSSLTSLNLIGRGVGPGYGLAVAQNTLSQLCNFASPNSPSNPLIGQMWYNSGTSTLEFFQGNATWGLVASEAWVTAGFASLAALQAMQAEVNAIQTAQQTLTTGALATLATPGAPGTIPMVNTAGTGYTFASGVFLNSQNNLPKSDNTYALGSSALRFNNIYAVTFNGVATSAQYADLAERYEADCELEAGDVVMLGGEKEITKTSSAFSTDVFGVISENPAYMMNASAGSNATHPYVALAGRLPVKVTGTVKKGQRLVSSDIPGVAIAADTADISSSFVVIGRALADKTTSDIGLVEIVVGAK